MQHWHTEQRDGVFVAAYHNPPTNYMIAPAIAELGELSHRSRRVGRPGRSAFDLERRF